MKRISILITLMFAAVGVGQASHSGVLSPSMRRS